MKHLPLIAATLMLMASCAAKKQSTLPTMEATKIVNARPLTGSVPAFIPKAVVYKTNGNYNDNVPVQVNDLGEIVSFPAPSDLKGQQPLAVGDGFLLDRRGISLQSRFTTYTYAQYAAMKQTPTVEQLKAAIIPGARVVQTVTLPITLNEALADTAAIKNYLPKP